MSYLGIAIGSLAGLSVVYFGSDRVSESMAKKHGVKSPEVLHPRFIAYQSTDLFCTAGLSFCYPLDYLSMVGVLRLRVIGIQPQRYCVDDRIVPIMGTFIFGFGTVIVFVKLQFLK